MFPDAKFIIPIRHPYEHVESLMRQHQIFQEYCRHDSRVAEYLQMAGHYEFGPQRVPINTNENYADQIIRDWNSGREHLGYARQWLGIYRYLAEVVTKNPDLRDQVIFVRYEDLVTDSAQIIDALLRFSELEESAERLLEMHKMTPRKLKPALSESQRQECWDIVGGRAAEFGYFENSEAAADFSMRRFTLP